MQEDGTRTPVNLSVVITVISGASHLADCLASLASQQGCNPGDMETIVPYDEKDQDIPRLQQKFPTTRFHPITLKVTGPAGLCHEHFDALRAAGLHLASGRIIALLEDHERPDANWCHNLLEAHRQPHAAVGGAVENDIDKSVNWATWFLDFGRYQNPVFEGPSAFLTDVNIGYKRAALQSVRHTWEHGFSEPDVHAGLIARGETLWLSPDIVVYQHRTGLTVRRAMRERYVWGRFFAGNRIKARGLSVRIAFCAASVAVPGIILLKKTRDVIRKKRHRAAFLRASPLILLLTLCWAWGEFTGYFTGKPSAWSNN